MAKSKRAGARTTVVRHLREIKQNTATLLGWWTPGSTVYVMESDRKPGDNAYLRDREQGEYPENQAHYWASTIHALDELQDRLAELRQHCLVEYNATKEK